MAALHDQQGLAEGDGAVERAFPIRSGWNAGMFVEVEEGGIETVTGQPVGNPTSRRWARVRINVLSTDPALKF